MSSGHLDSVLQMIKVKSFIQRIESCSLLRSSSFSISAALSFPLIFLSSSLGWGSAPFLDSLSWSSSAFLSASSSLISDSVWFMPYWMTPSSLRLVSMISLSLSLSVQSAFLSLTFCYRASLSFAMQASTSWILAVKLLMRLLQLAIFFIFSSLCISSLISSRVLSQSCIWNPVSLSFPCTFKRLSEVFPAYRLNLANLEVLSLSSASNYFRKTSSNPSRLLSSFSTLRSVRYASSCLVSISTFLSLREATIRLMVDCFFCKNSWSSRSLPFLRGSLVMVPEESMNSPLVVITRYRFSSQQATFMAVSSLLVTSVFPSDQISMPLVSWSVHLQTSQSSLVSLGQEVAGRSSLVASRMDSLMRRVILPSLRLLRQSSTSRACRTFSTMKQSRCGRMVSTTSAQAASMISSSLRVSRVISLQITFSLLAERISLIIRYWLVATFSFGFSLICRSICWRSSSFSAKAAFTSFTYSSADFNSVLHLRIVCLFYLYFTSQMASFSLSARRFVLSYEHLAAKDAYSFWILFSFSPNQTQILNLPILVVSFIEPLISLILPSSCACCCWIYPSYSTSAVSRFRSCCLFSLSLRAKVMSRLESFTFSPAFSFFCSTCSMYSSPFRYSAVTTFNSARFSLSSSSLARMSFSILEQAVACTSSASFSYRQSLWLSRKIFFMTRCCRSRTFIRSSIQVACSPARSLTLSKTFLRTFSDALSSSFAIDRSMYLRSASSMVSLNSSEPETYSRQSTIFSGESQQRRSTSPCRMMNRFLLRSMRLFTSCSLSSTHPIRSPFTLQLECPLFSTLRVTLVITSPSRKVTVTEAWSGLAKAERWMRAARLSWRSLADLKPKTKRTASMMLDLPLPLGPMTQVKWESKGPSTCLPLQDLKFSSYNWWISMKYYASPPAPVLHNKAYKALPQDSYNCQFT